MKKRLTATEEFEIMKLVLDKFLWIGLIVMLYGAWKMINTALTEGLLYIIAGVILLVIFVILIVKEYEIIR